MGIFGNPLTPLPDDFNRATPSVQIDQPRRGMFGGMDRRRLGLIAAGLSDAFDPLTMNPTGGGQLAAMRSRLDEQDAQERQASAFSAAFDPATGKLDPAKLVAALGGEAPASMWASLMPKDRQPQVIQGPNGAIGVIDADDPGSYREIRPADVKEADPLADLRRQLLEAQIGSIKAQEDQRRNQGAYYGARAAQPYAPPRPRASGGGGKAAVPSPSGIDWDDKQP